MPFTAALGDIECFFFSFFPNHGGQHLTSVLHFPSSNPSSPKEDGADFLL